MPRSGWRQRSSASKPAIEPSLEPHDRLVVQLELAGVDRALEVRAQLEAGEHVGVHRGLEQPVAALAVALGGVHRRVGVADQLLGACACRPRRRPRRRGCVRSAISRPPARTGAASRSSTRWAASAASWRRRPRAGRRTRRRRSGRRCRPRASRRRGAARDRDQHLVADRVPERVVDLLEVVEIEEEDGERAWARGAPRASAWRVCSMNIGAVREPGHARRGRRGSSAWPRRPCAR